MVKGAAWPINVTVLVSVLGNHKVYQVGAGRQIVAAARKPACLVTAEVSV